MVTITKIRKKGNCFLATLSDGSVEKLSSLAVFDFAVSSGNEFETEKWNEIKKESEFHLAYDSAMRILSIRAHGESELAKKLRAKRFNQSTVYRVLEECRRLELMDDVKFAEEYLRELRTGGAGSALIKMKLRAKGLSQHLIDSTLDAESSPDAELESAKIALSKKEKTFARETDPYKRKEKTFRYLASKGFSYDIISLVCGEDE